MAPYNHLDIEQKWQRAWEVEQAFATPVLSPGDEKLYVLDFFPYPSGAGLHVGHILGYTCSDIIARVARMQGKKVLHPMGWDAFGLPAENYAIKTGVHPSITTATNIKEFKRQFNQAGLSYDWGKELNTSDPAYYKWTQWLFSFMYERGLAYRKNGLVNWCPNCQTVLANEQVVGGHCDRCGTAVVQKELLQWYFKITDYADRLIDDLDDLDWPERIKSMQRNWIGRSEGAQLFFKVQDSEEVIEAFTTRPDTIFGATYVVLAPEHPLVPIITTDKQKGEVVHYQEQVSRTSELERTFTDREKTGVFTGAYAINPATKEPVQIWIADYVLSTYGTGAIMAVPAHDERDNAFALKFDLPIKQVLVEQITQETEPAKYRPDQPLINGESVIVFIKHPTEEKYLGLDWKEGSWGAKTLLTGTIEGGISAEETVLKEIREETGYQNPKIVSKLGVVDGLFYHLPKKTNKLVRGHVFLVELPNEEPLALAADEAARHDLKWLTTDELADFLTPETHKVALGWLQSGAYSFYGHGSLIDSGDFTGRDSSAAGLDIATFAGGNHKVTYRLRDWLVSRQRFWGAPIPIAYDKDGAEHLLPEDQLPVLLPTDVEFLPTGQSPLALATEWRQYTDPASGEVMQRETDTLDGFVCSSWYFLRFPTPALTEAAFDAEAIKQWLPVDLYLGGAEHAVMHLLYARFFTKVLYDAGLVPFKEPFASLKNQGMILGPDHNKMSKSKGNVISPDQVVAEHGADTLRVYEMFMGPFDVEKPWSVQGIVGVRRFLERVWKLQDMIGQDDATDAELRIINKAVKKVTDDVDVFRFNTAVSGLMQALNELNEQKSVSKESFLTYVRLLSPLAPHISEELWSLQGQKGFCSLAEWPDYDPSLVTESELVYPVQINGKIRAKLTVAADISEEELLKLVFADTKVQDNLMGKEVVKQIVVPGRLVSLVVK